MNKLFLFLKSSKYKFLNIIFPMRAANPINKCDIISIAPDKKGYPYNIFLISQ